MNNGQNILQLHSLRRLGNGRAAADDFDQPVRSEKGSAALRLAAFAFIVAGLIGGGAALISVGYTAGDAAGYWRGKAESMDNYFTDAAARMNALQPKAGKRGQ